MFEISFSKNIASRAAQGKLWSVFQKKERKKKQFQPFLHILSSREHFTPLKPLNPNSNRLDSILESFYYLFIVLFNVKYHANISHKTETTRGRDV